MGQNGIPDIDYYKEETTILGKQQQLWLNWQGKLNETIE